MSLYVPASHHPRCLRLSISSGYHLVWTPKQRRALLQGAVGSRLGQVFVQIGQACDIEIETMHVASDHVHLLCSFPQRLSISQAVTRFKWLAARALFGEFPDLRRQLFGGQLWSEATLARREVGYFVRTVGESLTGATIRRYIEGHQADDAAEDQDEQSAGQRGLF